MGRRQANPPSSALFLEIDRRRHLAGIRSMRQLTLLAGLEESAIKSIKYGRSRHPNEGKLGAIARALNCTIEDLMRGARSINAGTEPGASVAEPIPSATLDPIDAEVTRLLAAIFHALGYTGIGYRMALIPASELVKRLQILSRGQDAPER